jgi:hypothetical protein
MNMLGANAVMVPGLSWRSKAPAPVERLQVEQRLLAALFRWPQLVDVEPSDFVAAPHAALFWAMQEVHATWPVEAVTDVWRSRWWYCDMAQLALVIEVLRADDALDRFKNLGGVKRFVLAELAPLMIMPSVIDELVAQVRACPRCGR